MDVVSVPYTLCSVPSVYHYTDVVFLGDITFMPQGQEAPLLLLTDWIPRFLAL